ncbi:MAG TPA: hypothetical protein VHA82_22935 [Ramlibacter sp.]|uniref:hypothetical protein n=1 Tax=Ramlibacter sp. TaxID=1917967 RepID=UPI002D01317E|nr:hypothetical protein [Ramlibacter sp.]HVZ46680.1 hypothetical protein [Ramlibacter sp.]
MSTDFTELATRLVDGFDVTAHRAIETWRLSSERLGDAAKARWDAALKESSPRLDAETRRNAKHLQQVCGGYYTRGVEMTATGASIAIDTLVQAARAGLDRVAARTAARA